MNSFLTQEQIAEYQAMQAQSLVSIKSHPEWPTVHLIDYTEKVNFSNDGNLWTPALMAARGLIVNFSTGEILARPFPKFFNVGQQAATMGTLPPPTSRMIVSEKVDGSLGIVYRLPGNSLRIATRGSFTSPQAQHATNALRQAGRTLTTLMETVNYTSTILFEIVYPGNKVVVDYEGADELVLLDVLDRETGKTDFDGFNEIASLIGVDEVPGFRVRESYEFTSMEQVAEKTERQNFEGYVVYWAEEGLRLKVKAREYMRLHKLMTNLSPRRVLESLTANNGTLPAEFYANVPDEFADYLKRVLSMLRSRQEKIVGDATAAFESVKVLGTRKAQAIALNAKGLPKSAVCLAFCLLDGKEIVNRAWDFVEVSQSENVTLFQSRGVDPNA